MVRFRTPFAKRLLKRLLYKLGIKSAGITTLEETLEDMMLETERAFGKPDEMFTDTSTAEYLLKLLEEDK